MHARLAIGDFAKMTHLSVKALRHYHDVGLLVPAEIDPASGCARHRGVLAGVQDRCDGLACGARMVSCPGIGHNN
jgi:MerR family regulatory protein